MKPVIITTPRTGATLVCKLLAKLCGYKSNLNEFFFITDHAYNSYSIDEQNVVHVPQHGILTDKSMWDRPVRELQLERLNLIKNNPSWYMLKIQTWELDVPEIRDFVMSNYYPVFLERKNTINQILSYTAMMDNINDTKLFHHFESSKPIGPFNFSRKFGYHIIYTLRKFHKFKNAVIQNNMSHTVLYYEDLISDDTKSVLQDMLGIAPKDFDQSDIDTIKTKYITENLENLIINKDEWNNFKEKYIK